MYSTNIKPIYSPEHHQAGLKTLEALWSRGIAPAQAKTHWFFTWYTLHNCNMRNASKVTRLHRNTLYSYFNTSLGLKSLIPFRRLWNKNMKVNPSEPFEGNFHQFWKNIRFKFDLSAIDNAALIGLWRTGFPARMLPPCFVLWALRNGKSRDYILNKFEITHRNTIYYHFWNWRLKKSKTYYWLGPMNPTRRDWGLKGKKGRKQKAIVA